MKFRYVTKDFIIKGLVQGIGYRPWVARLAEELHIDGWVRNTGGIVTIRAAADEGLLDEFYNRLSHNAPEGGFVTSIEVRILDSKIKTDEKPISNGFRIIESNHDKWNNLPLIPPDIATCKACEQELFDKNNRRYLHPFISCTICGPRYSIIENLPYDRNTITMDAFEMCTKCRDEYVAKADRRRHAQTIACKKCGPRVKFKSILEEKVALDDEAINSTINHIKKGGIVAIKDIGGYHLACNPFGENTVSSLRLLKHREAKALAVMFYNVDQIKKYCEASEEETKLLESSARPIVLLKRKDNVDNPLATNVYLTSPYVGAMLPSNPIQIMLTRECGPLIMTSGNASGDVLEIDNDNMLAWLNARSKSDEMRDVPLAILSHDRRILRPMDDSVMQVIRGRQQFIRRGRGHVPSPIPVNVKGEVFAAGGDLKASFCFVKNGLAYVGQYLGDMESVSCQTFYQNEKNAMISIFGFRPDAAVVDKHPNYFSRKMGQELADDNVTIREIQHHRSHVASVIAEHNIKGKILGFAFDGTGYGDDGTIWGSETFLWDGNGHMDRVAHLRAVKMIGGDEGAKSCDTILSAMLLASGISYHNGDENKIVQAAIKNNINTITSTSMGRLFDAVSALLDICHYNSYEGQAPIELENIACKSKKAYPLAIDIDGDTSQLFKDMVSAVEKGIDKSDIARGFIYAVSDYIVKIALSNEQRMDENKQVVLSGGTFLNRILIEDVIEKLENKGFKVYTAKKLPPGDGGICLGQAYLSKWVAE